MTTFFGSQIVYAWCSICDVFQTYAIEQFNNPGLKNLVSLFGLSGDLLL
jgi:hypothetical protein